MMLTFLFGHLSVKIYRATDPEFEGLWSPEEEYVHENLYKQYSRAIYFSLVITYGNDLSKHSTP